MCDRFSKYGEVGDYYIPRNSHREGNRGFGFVRFVNKEDAEAALKEDGTELLGKIITVKIADQRPPRRK